MASAINFAGPQCRICCDSDWHSDPPQPFAPMECDRLDDSPNRVAEGRSTRIIHQGLVWRQLLSFQAFDVRFTPIHFDTRSSTEETQTSEYAGSIPTGTSPIRAAPIKTHSRQQNASSISFLDCLNHYGRVTITPRNTEGASAPTDFENMHTHRTASTGTDRLGSSIKDLFGIDHQHCTHLLLGLTSYWVHTLSVRSRCPRSVGVDHQVMRTHLTPRRTHSSCSPHMRGARNECVLDVRGTFEVSYASIPIEDSVRRAIRSGDHHSNCAPTSLQSLHSLCE